MTEHFKIQIEVYPNLLNTKKQIEKENITYFLEISKITSHILIT